MNWYGDWCTYSRNIEKDFELLPKKLWQIVILKNERKDVL